MNHAPDVDTEFNPQYGNGSDIDHTGTGWLTEPFSVPLSAENDRELVIGAYNNNATYSYESEEVFIDDVTIVETGELPFTGLATVPRTKCRTANKRLRLIDVICVVKI